MSEYKTTIKVSVGRDREKIGERAVVAYMVGKYLAVHEDPDQEKMIGELWSITHVPTGFAVRKKIETKAWAIDVCHDVEKLMDWNFDKPEDTIDRPGLDLVLDALYPDREAKHDPIRQEVEIDLVPDPPDKLKILAENEGYEDISEFILDCGQDSVMPGICSNPGCEYSSGVEPDAVTAWCEICETNTVKSAMILAGFI